MRGAWLVLVLLLAGCVAPTAAPVPAFRTAFLTERMTLDAAPEAAAHAVRAGSFFAAWAEGADYPTWRTLPQERGVLVMDLALHVFVQVTGPVARTVRFPDIMAYGGSGDAWMGYGNVSTDPALLPGRVYDFTIPIGVPAGGLWVPAGQPLGVKVVPLMHQNDAADVEILMGPATPSGLAWREIAFDAQPSPGTRGHDEGDVTGSAYAGAAAPESVRHAATIHLDAPPTQLLAWMNTTSHEGIPDIDLALVAPNGTQVAFSGTPTPKEMLRLGEANFAGFAPGDYRLVATSYGSARATVSLDWTLSAPTAKSP